MKEPMAESLDGDSVSETVPAELIMTVDDVTLTEVHDSTNGYSVQGKLYLLQEELDDGSWGGFLNVGNANLPLVPNGQSELKRDENRVFTLSIRAYQGSEPKVCRLEFGEHVDEQLLAEFEDATRYFIGYEPIVNRPNRSAPPDGKRAQLIKQVSDGVAQAGVSIAAQVAKHAPGLDSRIQSRFATMLENTKETGKDAKPGTVKALGVTKGVTGVGVRVTKGVSDAVQKVVKGTVGEGAVTKQLEKGPEGGARYQLAGLLESGLFAYGAVYTECDLAGRTWLASTTAGTSAVMNKKHGPQAAEAVEEVGGVLADGYAMVRNVNHIGYKAVAKAVLKNSVKRVVSGGSKK